MSRLQLIPIVEGHGEDSAVRILLERVWTEFLGGEYINVLRPIRGHRMKLVQSEELKRAVDLAALKLMNLGGDDPTAIMILLDADSDSPCVLGPHLLQIAKSHRGDMDIFCVLAKVEYETWFVAAAHSLGEYLEFPAGEKLPDRPEDSRSGKAWIQQRFKGMNRYSPPVDQAPLTKRMNLKLARDKSPSFDKLCRELEKRLESQP